MKKRFFRHLNVMLLLCVLLTHSFPVSASDTVQFYTTEIQSATLSDYAFQADAIDFSVSHRYRDQLMSEAQKTLYDLFIQLTPANNTATVELETLPQLPAVTDPSFQNELGAFLTELVLPSYAAAVQDTPTLFWTYRIGYSCTYGILGDRLVSVTAICTVIPTDGFSASNYAAVTQELTDVLQGLSFEVGNRKELLRQFHDYLCNSIVYKDSAYAHNIYGALVKGEAVCEGYAKSFKLFCDLYEIPCMLITGVAVAKDGMGAHAWNAVRMENGEWYGVDVTWDDQDKIYYDFFLIGSQSVPESFTKITFEESHLADGDFYGNGVVEMVFPTLSENAYTHTHMYDSGTVTVAPTCQKEGTVRYACLGCEISYSETLPVIGHDYQNGICTVCGDSSLSAVKCGDCNGDGQVNGKDITRLLRYLASYDPTTATSSVSIGESADCNGDGVINGKDATRLLRYLADFDPATGKSSVTLGK